MRDFLYALRQLASKPGFSAAAILSLGLGIGANTAIFGLLDTLLFRPLPVRAPQELIKIGSLENNGMTVDVPGPLLEHLRKEPLLDGVCGIQTPLLTVEWNNTPQPMGMLELTGDCYRTLGVRAAIGRLFTPADDIPNGPHVAVLSYGFWQDKFAENPGVLGKEIRIQGVPFTIIGVTERRFRGLLVGYPPAISFPISATFGTTHPAHVFYWANVLARLRTGVRPEQVRQRLRVEWRRLLEQALPDSFKGAQRAELLSQPVVVTSGASGVDYSLRDRFRGPLLGLLGISALVLLGAGINVANLLLARGQDRRREIAVRLALGAGRGRIIQQLVVETGLLICGGLICAVLLGWASDHLLLRILNGAYYGLSLEVAPDVTVLLFTSVVTLLVLLLFGVFPAWQMSDVDASAALKSASRSVTGARAQTRRILIAMQVALTLILVLGASVFVETLQHLKNAPLGFQTQTVLNAQLIPLPGGTATGFTPAAYFRELIDGMNRLPGVDAVSLSSFSPLFTLPYKEDVGRLDSPDRARGLTPAEFVSDGFFDTMRIPLLAGQTFRRSDTALKRTPESQKTAIVSKALAERLFPNGGALGQHIRFGTETETRDLEIVGIAGNAQLEDPRTKDLSFLYLNFWQLPSRGNWGNLQLRYAGSTAQLISAVRMELRKAGHQYALSVHTISEQRDTALLQEKLLAGLGTCFGILALTLAAVGLFGLLSFSVAARTSEMGIRMALGADRRDISWLVLREAFVLVGAGLLFGLPLCYATVRALSALLYGIAPIPVLPVLVSMTAVCAVAGLATWLPVYRASSVDPSSALKYE